MDVFIFLWIYFTISLCFSLLIFVLYSLLLRYGKNIRRSDASKAIVAAALLAASITFLWYSISITLTIFNKWLMTRWHGGFKFPLLTSSVHMVRENKGFCTVMFNILLYFLWCPLPFSLQLFLDTYLWLIVPIGVLTSVDISLSNTSLIYIPVSLYTTVKASVLIYTFLFSVYLDLEPLKLQTFLSIFAMMIGVCVAVISATHISLYGVALCLGASFSGALRWVLMHYFIKMHMEGHQVMVILYKISPIAFISLFPVALLIEGSSFLQSPFMIGYGGTLQLPALLLSLFGGLLASVLIFVEMVLLAATSSLTFTVLGQVKEIIQIILSMLVFNDNLTTRSICGIIFSLLAANNYRKIKMQEMHQIAKFGDKVDDSEGDDDVEQLLPRDTATREKASMELSVAFDDDLDDDDSYF